MKKYLIALSALAFATTSCYEKLNIAPPNAITNEQVQELLKTADDETIETILGAIANTLKPEMYGSGYNFRYSGNLDGTWSGQFIARLSCGNDIVEGNWQNPGDDYYNGENITGETNANNPSWWHRAFRMTTTANKAATMINEELIAENPSNLLKKYLGEIYVIRAFGYLYAQETFGTNSLGMPIYTKYDISQPAVARASAKETLDSVIRWATRADALFEAAGVGFKATPASDLTRGLTNYVIARAALLAVEAEGANASTYFATASAACDKMLGAGASLMTEEQYVQKQSGVTTIEGADYPVWKAATSGFMNFELNPEALYGFGWQYGGGGQIVTYANTWGGSYRIDDRLYNKIDPNDYRKDNFHVDRPADFPTISYAGASSFIDGGTSEVPTYWTSKFTNNVGLGGEVGNSNVTVRNRVDYAFIRLSEIYLMKAEIQARTGDEGGAKNTLNTLLNARTKAGATPLTCDNYQGMSGLSALQMVQLQSRIELWGEYGRLFDVRRLGQGIDRRTDDGFSEECISMMNRRNVNITKADTYDWVLTIPKAELDANPNINEEDQNP